MTTVALAKSRGDKHESPYIITITWANLANGDDGGPFEGAQYADRSVQVTGTFGSGGTVLIEGSNDGTNYSTLTDAQGNALSIQAAKIEMIAELVRYIRPRVSAGDGDTDITVTLLAAA